MEAWIHRLSPVATEEGQDSWCVPCHPPKEVWGCSANINGPSGALVPWLCGSDAQCARPSRPQLVEAHGPLGGSHYNRCNMGVFGWFQGPLPGVLARGRDFSWGRREVLSTHSWAINTGVALSNRPAKAVRRYWQHADQDGGDGREIRKIC